MTNKDPIVVGAVAYDAKVVPIWEGMRTYFRDEAKLDVEIVLFLNYGEQVRALLQGRIDIAWNTNVAYLQSEMATAADACRPLAMRDTDVGWTSEIIALNGGTVTSLDDLRGKTLAVGSRDSGHAAILPLHFLAQQGLVAGRDFTVMPFDSDVGKHGDTGTSELDVLKAVLDGRADAGAVGRPFLEGLATNKVVPAGALSTVWTSPAYSHCVFTARPDLAEEVGDVFVKALSGMSWENPKHRPTLEAEGLKRWVAPVLEGYHSLREAMKDRPAGAGGE